MSDDVLASLDDAALWTRIRADLDVMLWHGPHPAERIFALRACWHLRDRPERVFEVAIRASGAKWPGRDRPAFYDAVSISMPDVLAKAWERRSRVRDVEARAKRWEALRSIEGDWIRTLDGDEIVQHPVGAFDGVILARTNAWTESLTLLAAILAENAIGFAFLRWRVCELLRDGSLESRGTTNRIGLPAEIHRAR